MMSTRTSIQEMAKDAFKDHVLTVLEEGKHVRLYRCAKPGSNNYSFNLVFAPGCITVYGDIGDGMVMRASTDMLGWLRGSYQSTDYVIEKMPQEFKEEEFSEYDMRKHWEYLKTQGYPLPDQDDEGDDYAEERAKLTDEALADIIDADNPLEAWYNFDTDELNGDGDYRPSDYKPHVYWTYEALCKFVSLYESQLKSTTAPIFDKAKYYGIDK